MRDLSKIVAKWPGAGSYSPAPADFPFCTKGTRLQIHDNVRIGEGVRLGDWTTLEAGVRVEFFTQLGEYVSLDRNVVVGRGATLGDDVFVGKGARIGEGAVIGTGAAIGRGAIVTSSAELGNGAVVPEYGQHTVDLGLADGYRKCISEVAGVAIITAGCRTFTLDEALDHWGHHHLNRDLTMCLLEAAQAIARIRGWAFSRNTTKKGRNHATR